MEVAVPRRVTDSCVRSHARWVFVASVACAAVPAAMQAQARPRPATVPELVGTQTTARLVLAGSVRDTTGARIPYALVKWGAGSIVTNDSGAFEVRDVADGLTRFSVRRIGFQPVDFDVTVSGDTTRHVVIEMAPIPLALTTVNIDGDADDMRGGRLTQVGFFERRRRGRGTFLGPEDVEQRHAQTLSDIMAGVPGVTMVGRRRSGSLEYHSTQGCKMDVFLDGHPVSDLGDNLLNGSDIKAIEVYSNVSAAPPQFVTWDPRKGYCGSVVVWTK